MVSPHISSAFAHERQARYRQEADGVRLARGRGVTRRPARRGSTSDPPTRLASCAPAPSPVH
jgi:hypothetical protein